MSSNPDADAAMERYARGDERAFEALYDALAPRLYKRIHYHVRNRERAEDLVQQTFQRMCEKRGTYLTGSSASAWAASILMNLFIDQARRKKLEVPDDGIPDSASDLPDPEECTSVHEQSELVRRAIERLPPGQHDAMELVCYQHLSHAEAAEVLDVSVASITLRIQRANQTLRATLDDSSEDRHDP